MLFGPHSLINYVKYKNSLWGKVRKSYRQLQLYQRDLETFLKEPANPSTPRRAKDLFMAIRFQWATLDVAEHRFEETLCKYKLTTPTDLELALYREYLLLGSKIMESCAASLAEAGFVYLGAQ
jgi:hypothetical protein